MIRVPDGTLVRVSPAFLRGCLTVRNMAEHVDDSIFPILCDCTAEQVRRIDAYYESTDRSGFWDIPDEELFPLLNVANYLEASTLFDDGCRIVGRQLRGKTRRQLEVRFGIENLDSVSVADAGLAWAE